MTRGGAMPTSKPTGWVYLKSDCTIRWRRGDREAYILRGNQVGEWTTDEVLATISVPSKGWSDAAEIKRIGENWVRTKYPHGPMHGRGSR